MLGLGAVKSSLGARYGSQQSISILSRYLGFPGVVRCAILALVAVFDQTSCARMGGPKDGGHYKMELKVKSLVPIDMM